MGILCEVYILFNSTSALLRPGFQKKITIELEMIGHKSREHLCLPVTTALKIPSVRAPLIFVASLQHCSFLKYANIWHPDKA